MITKSSNGSAYCPDILIKRRVKVGWLSRFTGADNYRAFVARVAESRTVSRKAGFLVKLGYLALLAHVPKPGSSGSCDIFVNLFPDVWKTRNSMSEFPTVKSNHGNALVRMMDAQFGHREDAQVETYRRLLYAYNGEADPWALQVDFPHISRLFVVYVDR